MADGACLYCYGDGMDPANDWLLPCPHCDGTGGELLGHDDFDDFDPPDHRRWRMSELLPCPFCGKRDAFVERADLSCSYVFCNSCSAKGPTEYQESDDEETPGEAAAIAAWNRRAHPAAAEIEALRRDAERLDSGCIMTHERDEFGEEYRCERRGLDLRTLIDEAIAEQESLND